MALPCAAMDKLCTARTASFSAASSPSSSRETILYTPSESVNDIDDLPIFDDEGSEPDSDGFSEDDESDMLSCRSVSLSPSFFDHETAFGRQYHAFKKGRYPLPNDELERHREETNHAMMLQLTQGHLFYADIGEYPQKIIDIGTGSGTWAIDVADLYPSASVIGTDLSPIQSTWVPVNLRWFVEDFEEPEWLHGSDYDLVHYRGVASMVKDLDGLLAKAYPYVKNGGWVEFQEIIPEILCDDMTMAGDDPLRMFTDITNQGMRKFGFEAIKTGGLEAALERAGFINIQCLTKKVPISTWPRDRDMQTLGLFMKAVILDALTALAAKPLAALDVTKEERRDVVELVKRTLANDSIHRYVNVVFCYGQKKDIDSWSDSDSASLL